MHLRMGETIARNMLSWLKLSINCHCCILLVVYIIISMMHGYVNIKHQIWWWFVELKHLALDNEYRNVVFNVVDCVWNVMAHAQKPDFVFRRNGRVHLNRRRGRQFSLLLAAKVYSSAVVMLDTLCSEVVWRVLATHSIRHFPLHFPSRASPCAITLQPDSTLFAFNSMIKVHEDVWSSGGINQCILKGGTSCIRVASSTPRPL